jgi:predicted DNA-binding transcriptional regulator YafY
MRYKRYLDIEDRLGELLRLIRTGRHTTRTLACALHVSRPTVSRDIGALRERGYTIRAVKDADSWAYEVTTEPPSVKHGSGGNHP